MKKFEFVILKSQVNSLVIEAENIDLADELAREKMCEMDWSEQDNNYQILDVNESGDLETIASTNL